MDIGKSSVAEVLQDYKYTFLLTHAKIFRKGDIKERLHCSKNLCEKVWISPNPSTFMSKPKSGKAISGLKCL